MTNAQDDPTDNTEPVNIYAKHPYGSTWRKYVEAQYDPLPLPRGEKGPPPNGFTGRTGERPKATDYEQWDERNANGNIAIRLGVHFSADSINRVRDRAGEPLLPANYNGKPVNAWCAIGLDVDNYEKGTGTKQGGEELRTREAELGNLPPTAILTSRRTQWAAKQLGSSVRAPGVIPGIRLFLIPADAVLNGNLTPNIEVIQRHHRYALAWPSVVEGRTYEWVWGGGDGDAPADEDYSAAVAALTEPYPLWRLPLLPEKWLSESGGLLRGKGFDTYETQLKPGELNEWADENLCGRIPEEDAAQANWIRGERGMCRMIAQAVDTYLKELADDPDGNNPAHEAMISVTQRVIWLAGEGHHGWQIARGELYRAWMQHVGNTGKRDVETAQAEFDRAWYGAIGRVEARARAEGGTCGREAYEAGNGCVRSSNTKGDTGFGTCMSEQWWLQQNTITLFGSARSWIIDPPNKTGLTDVARRVPYSLPIMPTEFNGDWYDTTDLGNAEMLADLYFDNVRYVRRGERDGFWKAFAAQERGDTEREGRWYRMEGDNCEISFTMLFRRCLDTWKMYLGRIIGLKDIAMRSLDVANNPADKARAAAMKSRIDNVRKHVTYCGRMSGIAAAEKAYMGLASGDISITLPFKDVDANPMLLGCTNGMLLLPKRGERAALREMLKSDMVTISTGNEYIPWHELPSGERELLQAHFDKVWPDKTRHEPIQVLLGMMLIGGNPEKKAINAYGPSNTGKTTTGTMIKEALGDYLKPSSAHLLNDKVLNPRIVHYAPARVVTISEPKGVVDAETLKMFTGNDFTDAELKGQNAIQLVRPMFTMLIMTNQPLAINNADDATEKRIAVVPFDHQFTAGDDLDATAEIELPKRVARAMLSWLVEGLNKYANGGLQSHPDLERAAADYASATNPYGAFLKEMCWRMPLTFLRDIEAAHAAREPYKGRKSDKPSFADWELAAAEWITPVDAVHKAWDFWKENTYGTGRDAQDMTWYKMQQYLNSVGVQRMQNLEKSQTNYCGLKVVGKVGNSIRLRKD